MTHVKKYEHLKIKLEVIISATNDFADDNYIGKGGFGKVYKGEIDHRSNGRTMVAVKCLDRFGQGNTQFWAEIRTLSLYNHENVVSLLGYCDDNGEKILVYKYACNKSLNLHLNKSYLTWVRRLEICIGAARGLAYLHAPDETLLLRVLHRDIKSANILLDENWKPIISDLGLSKFAPANKQFSYLVTNGVGTFGYCDPNYREFDSLTKESDVYSFGVVLFEVLCGRLCVRNNDDTRHTLIDTVLEHYRENSLNEIIFDGIKNEINPDSLKVFVDIAYQCLENTREERPLMTQIVAALEKALEYQSTLMTPTVINESSGIKEQSILHREESSNDFRFIMRKAEVICCVGWLIMVLCLLCVKLYKLFTEDTTDTCMLIKESSSWWIPKPIASFGLWFQIRWCQVKYLSWVLFRMITVFPILFLVIYLPGNHLKRHIEILEHFH